MTRRVGVGKGETTSRDIIAFQTKLLPLQNPRVVKGGASQNRKKWD